jgi:hypothetical protein
MLKNYISGIAVIIIMCFCVSQDIRTSVAGAMDICLRVIIPSLYAFMVWSAFLIKTGLYSIIGKPFKLVAHKVFKMTTDEFSVFVLSLGAGYPVGAKLIYDLKIPQNRAENLYPLCFGAGPAFIGGIASALYGRKDIFLLLFGAVTLANILTAVIIRNLFCDKITEKSAENRPVKITENLLIALSQSVASAAKALFSVCVSIVFFGILYAVLGKISVVAFFEKIGIDGIFGAVFEISNLVKLDNSATFGYNSLPLTSALLSFGGLCVLFQVFVLTNGSVKLTNFLGIRAVAAVLSATFTMLFAPLFLRTVQTVAIAIPVKFTEFSLLPSLFLFIMTIMFFLKKDWTKD